MQDEAIEVIYLPIQHSKQIFTSGDWEMGDIASWQSTAPFTAGYLGKYLPNVVYTPVVRLLRSLPSTLRRQWLCKFTT